MSVSHAGSTDSGLSRHVKCTKHVQTCAKNQKTCTNSVKSCELMSRIVKICQVLWTSVDFSGLSGPGLAANMSSELGAGLMPPDMA